MTAESLFPCRCIACRETTHASDCAVHNMPAYPNGPCDCRIERKSGYYSDRQIAERRAAAKRCICPSHASNRGECPIHDKKGLVR